MTETSITKIRAHFGSYWYREGASWMLYWCPTNTRTKRCFLWLVLAHTTILFALAIKHLNCHAKLTNRIR